MTRRGRASLSTLVLLTAVYVAAGKLGLSFALVHASASAVWPPTGIALAAFLLLGDSVWPAIFVGAFIVNATTAGTPFTSLGIALGNTLEGMAGAALVRRFGGGTAAFDRPQGVFRFVALAGLCAPAISASVGVATLCLGGSAKWSAFADIWLTWWLGDAGGAVVVAPVILLWARSPRPGWTRAQQVEVALLLVVLATLGAIAFGGFLTPDGDRSLSFLCLPPAIWTAFRFGRRETAAAVAMLSGIAVFETARGGHLLGQRENESLLVLQLFMGVVSVTSLSLAAVVSERREALEEIVRQATELARSNAELDEFARVVSHDLKAPLRGIASLASWIVEDCGDLLRFESRNYLHLLGERARRMSRLIDGVHRYSRVGRTRSSFESVDVRAVVEEVVDSLQPLRGMAVRIQGALPVVWYDRTQLAQIFQNLIQNALEHHGRLTGEVVVSCLEGPEEYEFSVGDDGVGIPESHLERVFQIFHVVDPTRETGGVGLAIVRKIVEMQGGSVSVASRPSSGSTFSFSIPKVPLPEHAPKRRASEAPSAVPRDSPRPRG